MWPKVESIRLVKINYTTEKMILGIIREREREKGGGRREEEWKRSRAVYR